MSSNAQPYSIFSGTCMPFVVRMRRPGKIRSGSREYLLCVSHHSLLSHMCHHPAFKKNSPHSVHFSDIIICFSDLLAALYMHAQPFYPCTLHLPLYWSIYIESSNGLATLLVHVTHSSSTILTHNIRYV